MSRQPAQFGPYKILALLGAGGMGQVFRARDERLGRDVALKILPDARDPESRRRFETEARAASALNHPNIVAVHDIGEAEGRPYIISELVDGESLRAEMSRGPIASKRLLDLAVQIADGLAAAHGAGITHRDLKPENVMIARDGRPKILDFGLARYSAVAQAGNDDATRTQLQTATGTILGTVGYMSPEQARAAEIDARSDQFSFGVLLYEMAARRRPFQGQTAADVLSSILRDEPEPLSRAAPRPPAPVRWIIERCLEKDPARRYASTADLHNDLRTLREHLAELSLSDPGVAPATAPSRQLWAPILVAIAASLAAGYWIGRRVAPPRPSIQLTPLSTEADQAQYPAWSPDGRTIAYVANAGDGREIFTRGLESPTPVTLTKGCRGCSAPFWSQDASEVYFFQSEDELWVVGSAGGQPRRVEERTFGAAMSPDGRTLVLARRNRERVNEAHLVLRDAKTGEETIYDRAPFGRQFIFQGRATYHRALKFTHDGARLAASVWRPGAGAGGRELWILPLGEGTPKRLLTELVIPSTIDVDWMPDDRHLIFSMQKSAASETALYLVDTASGDYQALHAATGEQVQPSLPPNGSKLAFVARNPYTDFVEVNLADGSSRTIITLRGLHEGGYAPKGDQLAYSAGAGPSAGLFLRGLAENWVRPLAGINTEGIPPDNALRNPCISPDGTRVAFEVHGGKHQIYVAAVGGGRALLLDPESADQHRPSWSPDGAWIAYYREIPGRFTGVAKIPSAGGGKPIHIVPTAGNPRWSPDGAWIGVGPVGTEKMMVCTPEGKPCRATEIDAIWTWSRDSRQAIYPKRTPGGPWEIRAIHVATLADKRIAKTDIRSGLSSFTLAPDGKRLMVGLSREETSMWLAEGFARP